MENWKLLLISLSRPEHINNVKRCVKSVASFVCAVCVCIHMKCKHVLSNIPRRLFLSVSLFCMASEMWFHLIALHGIIIIKLSHSQSEFCFISFFLSLREMRSQTKKATRLWLSASQAVCIKCWVKKNCGNSSRHLSNFRILLKQCSNRTSDSQHHFEKRREKNESHGCVAIVNVRFDVWLLSMEIGCCVDVRATVNARKGNGKGKTTSQKYKIHKWHK